MRIRSKILVPVIAVSVLLFSAAAAVAVVTTVSAALDGAKRQVGATVERYAYRMEARLESPFATVASVPVVANRVEYHAALDDPTMAVSDRNGEMRNLMGEIVGPVQRIDDPKMLGTDVPL
ncbi:MAG TPA: hypothetical protein PK625_01790, partial [Spirochaetales bacterium]|nr:hypothetical protein [Spirochaetales bacterium]